MNYMSQKTCLQKSCFQANEKQQTVLPATHATSSPTPARQTVRREVQGKAAATIEKGVDKGTEKGVVAAAAAKREMREKHVVALTRQVSLERCVRLKTCRSFWNCCTVVTRQE